MAHEISIRKDGTAEMFSGNNKTPWHGLGRVVSGQLTATEAIAAAGLDWKVNPMPVFVNGRQLPFPDEKRQPVCFQGICREDSGDCLGIVKGRYECIQNTDAFDFFDRIVGQGAAVYDTAGALRGGRQIWLLAKVNGDIEINGDRHREWALMVNSHDGSQALQVMWVLERVVCANTLSIALSSASNVCKIRHTSNWKAKEDQARKILGVGQGYFASIQDALRGMTEKLLTPEQMANFTKLLLPARNEDEVSTQLQNMRSEIDVLFGRGAGNKGQSRWDALNAVTDYADHGRGVRGDNSQLESSLLGSSASLKQRAFNILTNEDVMRSLLEKDFRPSACTTDSDFQRLIEKN